MFFHVIMLFLHISVLNDILKKEDIAICLIIKKIKFSKENNLIFLYLIMIINYWFF